MQNHLASLIPYEQIILLIIITHNKHLRMHFPTCTKTFTEMVQCIVFISYGSNYIHRTLLSTHGAKEQAPKVKGGSALCGFMRFAHTSTGSILYAFAWFGVLGFKMLNLRPNLKKKIKMAQV